MNSSDDAVVTELQEVARALSALSDKEPSDKVAALLERAVVAGQKDTATGLWSRVKVFD